MLLFEKIDSEGRKGTDYLPYINKRFRHYKNEKIYQIENLVWLGDVDKWAFVHREIGLPIPAACVRSVGNFLDHVRVQIPRFKVFSENPDHSDFRGFNNEVAD